MSLSSVHVISVSLRFTDCNHDPKSVAFSGVF